MEIILTKRKQGDFGQSGLSDDPEHLSDKSLI